MLLIVTPLYGWRREVKVFRFTDGTVFEAFQELNESLENREKYNITVAFIAEHQIEDWIMNNLTCNFWERVMGGIKYRVHVMHRTEA